MCKDVIGDLLCNRYFFRINVYVRRGIYMEQKQKRTVLLGNGINIQFGGKAYSNRFILSRIIFNARC